MDEAGRPLTEPSADSETDDGDLESGTIYVLRSRSEHPVVSAHRELIHKIGVTDGRVEARIAYAALDPTCLLADVEVVATYKLFNVGRSWRRCSTGSLPKLALTSRSRIGSDSQ